MSAKIKINSNSGGSASLVCNDSQTTDEVLTLPKGSGTLASRDDVIGVDQSWQDMKSSRALGVTYTNDTGKPIEVSIIFSAGGVHEGVSLSVDTVEVSAAQSAVAGERGFVVAIVPNGSQYSTATIVASTLLAWAELRG